MTLGVIYYCRLFIRLATVLDSLLAIVIYNATVVNLYGTTYKVYRFDWVHATGAD